MNTVNAEWEAENDRLKRALDNIYETYWTVRNKNPQLYTLIQENVDYMFKAHRDETIEKLQRHNAQLTVI